MANYSELFKTINDSIKANGNQEITGPVLNSVLKAMVSALGEGYQFMGIAKPSTNPGLSDGKVFYIATQTGTYSHFGGIYIYDTPVILMNNAAGGWSATYLFGYSNFIVDCIIQDWAGAAGDYIYIDFVYRNSSTVGSGIRFIKGNMYTADTTQALYLTKLGTQSGIKAYSGTLAGNLGTLYISVNWDIIPSGYNSLLVFPIPLPRNAYMRVQSTVELADNSVTETKLADNSVTETKLADNSVTETKLKIVFFTPEYESDRPLSNAYESGLYDCYVDTALFPDITYIDMWCFKSLLFSRYKTGGDFVYFTWSPTSSVTNKPFSEINVMEPVALYVGETAVGYVVFKDKQPFLDNSTGRGIPMDLSLVTGRTFHSYTFILNVLNNGFAQLEQEIEDIRGALGPASGVSVSLPDKIYAVVGDTLQLFYRGIIQAVDPYQYDILISCVKGKQYPRYFEYTPAVDDIGSVNFKVTVKDNAGNTLADKACQLITVNAAAPPASDLKVMCFGDSLTAAGLWCAEANRRLTGTGGTPAGKELTNIDFVGSMTDGTTGYFGVGGWTWKSYTQQGKPAYRFQVSGVSSLTVGAVYTNNGNTFTIREVNVTAGSGNVLCSVDSLTPAPASSGILTKTDGTGDSAITYTSVAEDSQNPLWDVENDKMSFIPYANSVSDGRIDVVYTLLSWNSQTPGKTDFTDVLSDVETFADTLHAEFPAAKLKIMGLQVPSVRGGMGANYGATGTGYADGYGMVITALNLNKAYQDFANRPGYADFVEFVNVSSQFDTEYNMPHNAEVDVNTRNADVKEWRDTNGVHPATQGYDQIADVVYRNFVANFC